MKISIDRRVRKTKQILKQGLIKLMVEKNVQSITVKELCEHCDINRGTFYSHYTDVYDLLEQIEKEILSDMEAMLSEYSLLAVTGGENASPILCNIFNFLAENADICRVMLCSNGDMAFVEKVKEAFKAKFMEEWSVKFTESSQLPSEYVFTFIVSGCIGILQQWIMQNMPQEPEKMAAMVEMLIVRGATAIIQG